MNKKLTEKERRIMQLILQGDDLQDAVYDPGSTIVGIKELSEASKYTPNQVKGIINALIKKGLVYYDNAEDEDYLPHLTVTNDDNMSQEEAKEWNDIIKEKI